MNDYNTAYEYKQVNTRDILVDELYQRDLDKNRVSRIVKKYDARLVNAVKVSFRDGRYYVFDGQHTIAVEKAVHKGHDCMVDCKVFYGLTRYDEMELFIKQNGESRGVGSNAKFRALFNNGDKDVMGMVRACESIGIRIDFTSNKSSNKIIALSSLFKVYGAASLEDFLDVLEILKTAWDGVPEGFCAEMLTGLWLFYQTYEGSFDRKSLIKKLGRTSPVAIIREAKLSSAPGSAKYARQIWSVYNNGTSIRRLPDKL